MMAPWPFAQWGLDILSPFSNWNQADEVLCCRDRLFHYVGRSRTLGKHHATECKELRLEKHCVQVWGALSTSVRQWMTI